MEVVSFQPPGAPKPAAPPPIAVNRMPLQPGVQRKLTDMERQALEGLGWQAGQAIPGNLAEHLAAIKATEKASLAADIERLASTPDLNFDPGRIVPDSSLSPAAKTELSRKIAEMNELALAIDSRSHEAPLPDSVAAAIKLAEAPPTLPAQPSSPVTAAPPATEPSPTGLVSHPALCPNCRWDMARTDVPEPTAEEKRQYLTAAWSGARYTREALILGGSVRLTFRELRTTELETILAQVNSETPLAVDQTTYMAKFMGYHTVAGLAEVEVIGRRRYPVPELAAMAGEHPMTDLYAWVRGSVLPTESLWSMAYAEHTKFRRLLERMIQCSTDEDFYRGIPGPA